MLFPPRRDLPHPGIEPKSLLSTPLAGESVTTAGFPGGSDGKESACSAGDLGLIPGFGKIPWRRERLPTPVLLTGEFHGQKHATVHGVAELDTAEQLTLGVVFFLLSFKTLR